MRLITNIETDPWELRHASTHITSSMLLCLRAMSKIILLMLPHSPVYILIGNSCLGYHCQDHNHKIYGLQHKISGTPILITSSYAPWVILLVHKLFHTIWHLEIVTSSYDFNWLLRICVKLVCNKHCPYLIYSLLGISIKLV